MKSLKLFKKLKKKCRIQCENHKKIEIIEFNARTTRIQKNLGIPYENHENHKKLQIT